MGLIPRRCRCRAPWPSTRRTSPRPLRPRCSGRRWRRPPLPIRRRRRRNRSRWPRPPGRPGPASWGRSCPAQKGLVLLWACSDHLSLPRARGLRPQRPASSRSQEWLEEARWSSRTSAKREPPGPPSPQEHRPRRSEGSHRLPLTGTRPGQARRPRRCRRREPSSQARHQLPLRKARLRSVERLPDRSRPESASHQRRSTERRPDLAQRCPRWCRHPARSCPAFRRRRTETQPDPAQGLPRWRRPARSCPAWLQLPRTATPRGSAPRGSARCFPRLRSPGPASHQPRWTAARRGPARRCRTKRCPSRSCRASRRPLTQMRPDPGRGLAHCRWPAQPLKPRHRHFPAQLCRPPRHLPDHRLLAQLRRHPRPLPHRRCSPQRRPPPHLRPPERLRLRGRHRR